MPNPGNALEDFFDPNSPVLKQLKKQVPKSKEIEIQECIKTPSSRRTFLISDYHWNALEKFKINVLEHTYVTGSGYRRTKSSALLVGIEILNAVNTNVIVPMDHMERKKRLSHCKSTTEVARQIVNLYKEYLNVR